MPKVAFCGESFEVSDKIGLMPLMRFAKVAKGGVDSNEFEGLVAMYDLIEQCLAPQEWQRFQDTADAHRADGEELMEVVKEVFELLSQRPTSRPSASSDGPAATEPSSTDSLSSRVISRLEAQGRPDLALMVPPEQRTA